MYRRKIDKEIDKWYKSLEIKKRALVIKGLRQIGKTTSVLHFCQTNNINYIYLNFMKKKSLRKIFDGDLNVDDILIRLSAALPDIKLIPFKTIIIFDELQECANARSSIKFFMEDGKYNIIATGSLLGLRGYNKKNSEAIPTGFEHIIDMKPMDFEEFLWAKGINENVLDYVKDAFNNKKKIDASTNDYLMKYFKEYLCVGGMPDAVKTFINTSDLNQTFDILVDLLEQYKDDFGKHLNEKENDYINKTELTRIMEIYNSLPAQLAKENKKFQYSLISKNAKSREYKGAITWLEEFGLIKQCNNLSNLELPLDGNKIEDEFKLYIADTGLFIAMLEKGTVNNIINGDLKIYKGAIFENIIAEAFIKLNKKLYYYKNNSLEIDFITRHKDELTLIEVKATNGNAKSLKEVLTNKNKYSVSKAIKLIDGNIGENNQIYSIPLYMAYLID